MRKEYLTCKEHPELIFDGDIDFENHVAIIHSDAVEERLDDYRFEVINSLMSELRDTVVTDVDSKKEVE